MKTTKTLKALNVALVLAMGVNMTACTEEEVATAIGAAAIVAGAVVIANNTTCHGGYRTVCNDYYTYRGHRRTECREVYDSCLYTTIGSLSAPGVAEQVVTDYNWSTTFKAGFEGSAKFVDALRMAKDEKKIDGLKALGLNKGSLKKIAKGEMPEEKVIDKLAQNLDQDVNATRDMLETLIQTNKEISKK